MYEQVYIQKFKCKIETEFNQTSLNENEPLQTQGEPCKKDNRQDLQEKEMQSYFADKI